MRDLFSITDARQGKKFLLDQTLPRHRKNFLPCRAFLHYKEAILGPRYELSVAVVSPAKMRAINRQYRKLDKPTDVLAFPLSKTQGEVFLCLPETKKEAKKFDRGYENFLSFLFIHACVHLLGYDHGTKMEKMEKKWRKKFNI